MILMKLSISASTPSSELGKIIDPDDCKVLYYSERVIAYLDKISTVASQKKYDLSFRFLHVLTNLNFWYQKHTLQLNATSGQNETLPKQEPESLPSVIGVSASQDMTSAMSTRAPMTSGSEAIPQDSHFAPYKPQTLSDFNLLQDNSRTPTSHALDPNAPELAPAPASASAPLTQATFWSNDVQPSSSAFPEPVDSFTSSTSNAPFDFPMDLDPNLFSQLFNKELYDGNLMFGGEDGMDYTNVPDTDWANWSQLL